MRQLSRIPGFDARDQMAGVGLRVRFREQDLIPTPDAFAAQKGGGSVTGFQAK